MLLFVNRRASPPSPMHVVQEAAISLPDSVPLPGGGEWGGGGGRDSLHSAPVGFV